MKTFILVVLFAATVAVAYASGNDSSSSNIREIERVGTLPPQNVTAKALSKEIQAIGPGKVLEKYYDTPAWRNSIMPGIEGANAEWLIIVQELHSAFDGAAAEDIGIALYFRALPRDPFRVVPLLTMIYGGTIEEACTISFEAEIPKGGVANYLASIRGKLMMAKGESEKAMASACLRGLEKTRIEAEAQGIK